jgi:hypothetical protein
MKAVPPVSVRPICGALLALHVVASANARTPLIETWDKGDWIVPTTRGALLYGASSIDADFAVAQWNNPSPLGAFVAGRCSAGRTNCFTAASPNITDSLYTDNLGNHWVDLLSAGTGAACYPRNGAELDNLQTAIGPVYRRYPQAVLASANVGKSSHLYLSVTAEPKAFATLAGAQCSPQGTAAAMLVAVVFNNLRAHQTLFYQLRLQGYRSPAAPGFFANHQPFGFRDIIGKFGVYRDGLPAGRPTALSIDILLRLKAILSTATNGLDRNPGNWTTGSAYMGQIVFGNVRAETAWCCFSLAAR